MTTKIEIVDESGHQDLVVKTGVEGLEKLEPYKKSDDYWMYLDGKFANKDTITAADIQAADNVKVALSQQGG